MRYQGFCALGVPKGKDPILTGLFWAEETRAIEKEAKQDGKRLGREIELSERFQCSVITESISVIDGTHYPISKQAPALMRMAVAADKARRKRKKK